MSSDETRTVVRAAGDSGEQLHDVFVLRVVEGPDHGKTYEVTAAHPSRVLLGKSEVCGIALSDPSVSRRHATVEVVDGQLRVIDLSSTNGTFVNEIVIDSARLRGGETLRLGYSKLSVQTVAARPGARIVEQTHFERTMGGSVAMRRLYPLCAGLAETELPVVIEGETGTGKEQLAESLHAASPRHAGPFVVFDCTAVAPNLIESEVFGHEKGSFTGSVRRHAGVFERAHGGTLLIDEIGDLPLELQPKLLRAIERGRVTPVGAQDPLTVDVRLLAATRRDLDREVQEGRFRDDLFHRIAVARIELPPLRDRKGDVGLLARHFWEQLGGSPESFPKRALRKWNDDPWPGNVRELRNAVTRYRALGDLAGDLHGLDRAIESVEGGAARQPSAGDWLLGILALDLPYADTRERVMHVFESRYVERLLETHHGDTARAAVSAGVARRHLQRIVARARGRKDE